MKKCALLPMNGHINLCIDLLNTEQKLYENDISLENLERIANMRYALVVAAELLYKQVRESHIVSVASSENDAEDKTEEMLQEHQVVIQASSDPETLQSKFLKAVQSVCKNPNPSQYLLKVVIRQFGFSFLKKLVKTHPWVIPVNISWSEEVCYVHTHVHINEFTQNLLVHTGRKKY